MCCPRAEDRPIFEDLRPRGQGQGLDLRVQGQELQNVSSRPRTSLRTPLLVRTQYYLLTLVPLFYLPLTSLNRLVFMIAEFLRREKKFSDSNAEQAVKRWFKGVIDRRGGRKLRAEKNGLKPVFV